MKKAISGFAEKLLERLCAGEVAEPKKDGSWRLGAGTFPPSVIASLERTGLARRKGTRLEPTEAGRRYLARSRWNRANIRIPRESKRKRHKSAAPADPPLSPWRAQHMIVGRLDQGARRGKEGDRAQPLRNLAETPLAWLARHRDREGRPFLDERLIAAGERLRSDFELAGLRPRMTVTYSPASSARRRPFSPPDGIACGRIDAHRRFSRALEAAGPGLCDILIEVCCFLNGLEAAERQLGWPQRAGKLVLKLALERLASHYEGRRTNIRLSERFTNMENIT